MYMLDQECESDDLLEATEVLRGLIRKTFHVYANIVRVMYMIENNSELLTETELNSLVEKMYSSYPREVRVMLDLYFETMGEVPSAFAEYFSSDSVLSYCAQAVVKDDSEIKMVQIREKSQKAFMYVLRNLWRKTLSELAHDAESIVKGETSYDI